MKIVVKEPNGPYQTTLDTEVMTVEIREAFLGFSVVTEGGERLAIAMRDSGFEVIYSGDFGETGFNAGMTEFKDGRIIGSIIPREEDK